ncbi:MAG: Mur ligase domain-containing protein, partial [Planctomycetota bacterium]
MTLGLKKAHLMGIGGSGMSGIAKILLAMQVEVSGCDTRPSSITDELSELGASIYRGHDASHLDAGTSALVHSAAVKADNPEIREAMRLNIPVLKYAQMLGRLLADKTGIAVSGTHGKTTTSAMIAWCMEGAKLAPSFVIGSAIAGIGRSSQVGGGPYFVVEACEYDRSFLNLQAHIAVTTNIEEDHLDYYRDLPEIVGAFGDFARLADAKGLYVVNAEDAGALEASREARARVETFGIGLAANWEASNLQLIQGCYAFDVTHEGRPFGD